MTTAPTDGDLPAFAAALRTAILDRGLSLERIRSHLAERGHEVSVATLSYWQNGQRRPARASSLAALGSLESILGVPRGTLASRLPTPARTARAHPDDVPTVRELFTVGDLIDEAVDALGISWTDLERIALHELLRVRPDRSVESHVIRETMRAARDGADRFVAFYSDDPRGRPYIRARNNCRVGRVIEHRDRGLVVAELLLPRPLAAGDAVLVDYAYGLTDHVDPCHGLERGFLQPRREVYLEVEFSPRVRPSTIRTRLKQGADEQSGAGTPESNLLSLLLLDVECGMVGLYCTW